MHGHTSATSCSTAAPVLWRLRITGRSQTSSEPYDHAVSAGGLYHVGFGAGDLPDGTTVALLSGDPGRSELIATERLSGGVELARNRGLDSFVARLPGGAPVVCATSGMGAP